jgi:hypothetical protein
LWFYELKKKVVLLGTEEGYEPGGEAEAYIYGQGSV